MRREAVHSPEAPPALGPYSPALCAGDTVYLSGQLGLLPDGKTLAGPGAAEQARQALANLAALARAAGAELDRLVKLTVYLTDLADFPAVNAVLAETLSEPYPARATVGVAALPLGARVEIEGVLVL